MKEFLEASSMMGIDEASKNSNMLNEGITRNFPIIGWRLPDISHRCDMSDGVIEESPT